MSTSKEFLSMKPVQHTAQVLNYIEGLVSILQILRDHSRPEIAGHVAFLMKGYIEQMKKESGDKNLNIRFILSQPIKAPVFTIDESIGMSSEMTVCCLLQIRFMDEEVMKNRKPMTLALSLDIKSSTFYKVGLSKSLEISEDILSTPADSNRITG